MDACFSALKIHKPQLLHEQVYDQLAGLIRSGKLQPGDRLPSTQRLADLLQTHVPTVHTALHKLAQEGWLTRIPNKGTFIRQREKKLTCVGVYDTVGSFRGSLFEQALQAALRTELTAAGIEMDVWLDPRPPAEQGGPGAGRGEPWQPLVKAAERRKFQALIAISTDLPHWSWQRRLPVPTAFQTARNIPNAVGFNLAQFAESSLRTLAQQGCRSVGIISAVAATATTTDDSHQVFTGFYGRITDLVGDLGLMIKNEWIRIPTVGEPDQEQFGYREFLKLWSQPKKPAGLIVFPDTAARGVILGLRENQVRVPEALKLVLHKNEAVRLLCPMPATFAVLSERAIAKALIAQIQKQFRGEPCPPIMLPFRLVAHPADSR